MLYSEKVFDHFSNPRNVGEIEDANGVGEVGNARCGDIMKMYLKIEDGIIKDVEIIGGCSGNIKGLIALVKGMKAEEAIERMKGITCGFKSTSCPDQLAITLEEALAK